MPGYIIHLATATEFVKRAHIDDASYVNDFLIGTIAPDARQRSRKKHTHFWSDYIYTQFVRKPDTDAFINKYGHRLKEPFVLGYYMHLLLDKRFIDSYWKEHFSFYDEQMKPETLYDRVRYVRMTGDDRVYSREEFFGEDMYYGDYNRMNSYYRERYNTLLPKLYDGMPFIDESIPDDDRERISSMLHAVSKGMEQPDMTGLRVFNPTDMNRLIEETVDIMVSCYKDILKREF